MIKLKVEGENITLDLLCHRIHGVRGREVVEQSFDLNPGLAAMGAILPLGTEVTIAELPARDQFTRTVIGLFD